MVAHQRVRDGEAEAGAALLLLGRKKRVAQPFDVLLWDADPAVPHLDFDFVLILIIPCGYSRLAAFLR